MTSPDVAAGFLKKWEKLSERERHEKLIEADLAYFVLKGPVIVDGKTWDVTRHKYQIDILKDRHPDQTWRKSAQMGASLMAIVKSIHATRFTLPHGTLYLIPTRTDVIDFSKRKFQKVVDENPLVKSWITETDAANMKKIGPSHILFRGMNSTVGLKVQDVDFLVYDEIEEASSSAISLAEKRVSHSEHKWKLRLSVPSDNDVGIDAYFQKSDQQFWVIKCKKCNTDVCMEDEFPECIIDLGKKVIRCCHKCKAEIDPKNGRWVAKNPDAKTRGYQISQLWSYYVDPSEILEEYTTTKSVGDFYNNTLGLPYTDVTTRITKEQVYSLCGQDFMAERDDGPCIMGVDPGNLYHVVVGKKITDHQVKVLRLGSVFDTTNARGEQLSAWDLLGRIMHRYNVKCCVIDGRPYIEEARRFASKFPGRVFLYFHSEGQRGSAIWRDGDWTVNINACEAMDASHAYLRDRQVELPRRSELLDMFAKHCHSVGRKLQEDEETGDRRYYWKKLGEDHFRRAFNLMILGTDRVGLPVNRRRRKRQTIFQRKAKEGYG